MTENAKSEAKDVLCETAGGETVYCDGTSLVAVLPPGRAVLSTSWLNGGYHEDIRMVFNHHLSEDACRSDTLEGGSIDAYLRLIASHHGFDPDQSTGMLTKADMCNAAVATHTFRDLTVTAVVTGGIEGNGGVPVTRLHFMKRTVTLATSGAPSIRSFSSVPPFRRRRWPVS